MLTGGAAGLTEYGTDAAHLCSLLPMNLTVPPHQEFSAREAVENQTHIAIHGYVK